MNGGGRGSVPAASEVADTASLACSRAWAFSHCTLREREREMGGWGYMFSTVQRRMGGGGEAGKYLDISRR